MKMTKIADLSDGDQVQYVQDHFSFKPDLGWFTAEDIFAGASEQDVIQALKDFQYAEIDAIGDCMTGFCSVPPKFEDFVRHPEKK